MQKVFAPSLRNKKPKGKENATDQSKEPELEDNVTDPMLSYLRNNLQSSDPEGDLSDRLICDQLSQFSSNLQNIHNKTFIVKNTEKALRYMFSNVYAHERFEKSLQKKTVKGAVFRARQLPKISTVRGPIIQEFDDDDDDDDNFEGQSQSQSSPATINGWVKNTMAIFKDELLVKLDEESLRRLIGLPVSVSASTTSTETILQQLKLLNDLYPKEYLQDIAISKSLKYYANLKRLMLNLGCSHRLDKMLPEPTVQMIRAVAFNRLIFFNQFLNMKSGTHIIKKDDKVLNASELKALDDNTFFNIFFKQEILEKAKKALLNEDPQRKVEPKHRFIYKDGRISIFFNVIQSKEPVSDPVDMGHPGKPASEMSAADKKKDAELNAELRNLNKEIKELSEKVLVLNRKRRSKTVTKDEEGFQTVGLSGVELGNLRSMNEKLLEKRQEADRISAERRYLANQHAKENAVPAKRKIDFASRVVKNAASYESPSDDTIVLTSDPGKISLETVGVMTFGESVQLSNSVHLHYEHSIGLRAEIPKAKVLPPLPSSKHLQVVSPPKSKRNVLQISGKKIKWESHTIDKRMVAGKSFSEYTNGLKGQGNMKNVLDKDALKNLQQVKKETKNLFIKALSTKEAQEYAYRCKVKREAAYNRVVSAMYKMGREYAFTKLSKEKKVVDPSDGFCSNCNSYHRPMRNSKQSLSYEPICEKEIEGRQKPEPIKILFVKGAMSYGTDYTPGTIYFEI